MHMCDVNVYVLCGVGVRNVPTCGFDVCGVCGACMHASVRVLGALHKCMLSHMHTSYTYAHHICVHISLAFTKYPMHRYAHHRKRDAHHHTQIHSPSMHA